MTVSTITDSAWRRRDLTVAGATIAAYEAGNADPAARTILLVHGLGHWTQAAWDVLLPLLDPALRVVAFDLPGFGASDKPDVRYDTRYFAEIVDGVVAALAPERFVLVGHSLGGYIAATYAAAHPERVERLALIAPAGFLRAPRFLYALLGSQIAQWLFTRKPTDRLVNRTLDRSVHVSTAIVPAIRATACALAQDRSVRRAFARVYAGAFADFMQMPALHAALAAWTGPTLIVWGRYDNFIPIRALDTTREVYPQARVVIADQSGHLPMVEEPALVVDALREFLAS